MIAAPGADVADTVLPLMRDSEGEFGRAYGVSETSVHVVRPDGYVGFASGGVDVNALVTHLQRTFG